LGMKSFLPTPTHRATSAANGKGFACPVRWRRKCKPLDDISPVDVARASGRRAKMGALRMDLMYYILYNQNLKEEDINERA
jgi:hypothetical protein